MRLDSSSDSIAVLSSCRFLWVKNLSPQSGTIVSSEHIADKFQQLSVCSSHRVLENIEIVNRVSWQPPGDELEQTTLSATALRCLFVFRSLRVLILEISLYIVPDDDALKDMAMSWPLLKSLHLYGHGDDDSSCLVPTAATLGGPAHFARFRPAPQDLTIDVETSRPETKLADGYQNLALLLIIFPHSFMQGNHARIGAYLLAMIPNFERINPCHINETVDKSWLQVQETITAFKRLASC